MQCTWLLILIARRYLPREDRILLDFIPVYYEALAGVAI